jgi:hypothetical protein
VRTAGFARPLVGFLGRLLESPALRASPHPSSPLPRIRRLTGANAHSLLLPFIQTPLQQGSFPGR